MEAGSFSCSLLPVSPSPVPSCASGQPADNVIKIPVQVFLSKERKDLVKEHHLLLQLNESELCHLHTVHQRGIHRLRSVPKVLIVFGLEKKHL